MVAPVVEVITNPSGTSCFTKAKQGVYYIYHAIAVGGQCNYHKLFSIGIVRAGIMSHPRCPRVYAPVPVHFPTHARLAALPRLGFPPNLSNMEVLRSVPLHHLLEIQSPRRQSKPCLHGGSLPGPRTGSPCFRGPP